MTPKRRLVRPLRELTPAGISIYAAGYALRAELVPGRIKFNRHLKRLNAPGRGRTLCCDGRVPHSNASRFIRISIALPRRYRTFRHSGAFKTGALDS